MPWVQAPALLPAERFGSCKDDMTEIHSLRLVCATCGARDWEATVFTRAGHGEAWLEGLTVSPMGGGRSTF
jgi:hypothetical protein